MTFTLLTQQEIDQIPHLIYKKILIEYNNVIDINTELNYTKIQKQAEINNMAIETKKLLSSIQNLNLSRSFLEIENEFYKMRVDSLNKVLDLLDMNYIEESQKSNKKRTSSSNSSTTNASVISKLIKKIKTLTRKYNGEKVKYKKLFTEFTEVLRARDQIYENLSKNQVDNKKLEECTQILNKVEFIEKEYFSLLDKCNRMDYEYNRLSLENKDLRYKYDRYVLSNRDDIVPVIGRELDNIKDKIFDFTSKIEFMDINFIFREYWKYIETLKTQILYYKGFNRHNDSIKEEINIINNILNDVNSEIDNNTKIYKSLVKEIHIINEIIQDLYKEKIGKEISVDYNYLLLEIHSYKKKINNLNLFIEEQNKNLLNLKSENEELKSKTENILNEKLQDIKNRDKIINEKQELINENNEIIYMKEKIISEKDEIIKKLSLLLSKLKKVKEEYITLKKSTQPE